jgi:hypothetical protein
MLTVQYAKKPVFSNAQQTLISLVVKFEEFDEELPFTADPTDCVAHGVEIFNRALAGEFGRVGAYTPPPIDEQGNATQSQPTVDGAQTL